MGKAEGFFEGENDGNIEGTLDGVVVNPNVGEKDIVPVGGWESESLGVIVG